MVRFSIAACGSCPTVFLVGTDPVKVDLVSSLASSGGNITGVTNVNVELISKCFELMRSLMPPAAAIAVLVNQRNCLGRLLCCRQTGRAPGGFPKRARVSNHGQRGLPRRRA